MIILNRCGNGKPHEASNEKKISRRIFINELIRSQRREDVTKIFIYRKITKAYLLYNNKNTMGEIEEMEKSSQWVF